MLSGAGAGIVAVADNEAIEGTEAARAVQRAGKGAQHHLQGKGVSRRHGNPWSDPVLNSQKPQHGKPTTRHILAFVHRKLKRQIALVTVTPRLVVGRPPRSQVAMGLSDSPVAAYSNAALRLPAGGDQELFCNGM